MNIKVRIIATCLWCEKEIPFAKALAGRMICSEKCLKDMKKKVPHCGYNLADTV